MNQIGFWGKGAAAVAAWIAAYTINQPLAEWLAYGLFGLAPGGSAGGAVSFFIYDTIKILLLLVFMVYGVAFFRAGLQTERLRARLAGTGAASAICWGRGSEP